MIAPGLLPMPDIHAPWPYHGMSGWTATALTDVLKLARFGAWAAGEFREHMVGVDGGDAQDAMERIGVLVKVRVTESCGEICNCAEDNLFPTDCYKFTPGVAQIVKECRK